MEISPHELNASYTLSGEFRVHRAGCRDIKREANNWDANYGDIRTPEGIAQDLWSDIIDEGGMESGEATDHVTFLPCCEFKQVEDNFEEVVDGSPNSTYTGVVGQEGPAGTQGVTMNATASLIEYTASLQAAKTTDLRKMASQAGIREVGGKKVNAGRKADLIDALTAKKAEELEISAAQASDDDNEVLAGNHASDAGITLAEAKAALGYDKAPKKAPKAKKAAKKDQQAALGTSAADDSAVKIRTARKFVAEADAKGWEIKIDNQMATEQGDVVIITATKGEESITLRWIDGAYDYYQGGSVHTDAKGKARKILNVSAAINRYL